MKLHYDILDAERKKLLPALSAFKETFYLAGGTGLALQCGHRLSFDFDFFTAQDFDSTKLYHDCEKLFATYSIELVQHEANTLSILLGNTIKISFLGFPCPVVLPLLKTEHVFLAQAREIGAMKIAALLRAAYRDYVDLYFLLQSFSLAELFKLAREKFRNFDEGIYLKCLLAYDDVEMSPVNFKKGFEVASSTVFECIELQTKEYLSAIR
jgi:hypothetical protein